MFESCSRRRDFSNKFYLWFRLTENDHDGIRTHNLLIRSQTPYPLGHATDGRSPKNKHHRDPRRKSCDVLIHHAKLLWYVSCDGRVVKALDLKSNGIFPRRFEPYSQRCFLQLRIDNIECISWVTTLFPYAWSHCAAMAEWLRRLTRNQMGSSRVGSNRSEERRVGKEC